MLKDDHGVDFLAMKLAVVLIVASVVLIFAAKCSLAIISGSSTAEARACAGRIAGIALAEYAEGCPGADGGATADVVIPGSVRMITFGAALVNGSLDPCSSTYTIRYKDGSNEAFFAGAPVGAGSYGTERGGPVLLYPGRYVIHIRVEPVGNHMMALLYPEAV